MLVPQGALEQTPHLKVCLGNVDKPVAGSTGLCGRMKAQIWWCASTGMQKLRTDWLLLKDVGGASVATVFPVQFCCAYSTPSLKAPPPVQSF